MQLIELSAAQAQLRRSSVLLGAAALRSLARPGAAWRILAQSELGAVGAAEHSFVQFRAALRSPVQLGVTQCSFAQLCAALCGLAQLTVALLLLCSVALLLCFVQVLSRALALLSSAFSLRLLCSALFFC